MGASLAKNAAKTLSVIILGISAVIVVPPRGSKVKSCLLEHTAMSHFETEFDTMVAMLYSLDMCQCLNHQC